MVVVSGLLVYISYEAYRTWGAKVEAEDYYYCR